MRRKKGLTLVELLVVIGLILFIATAFIFPAFERARGKATEVVCISNLRQIGQALLMYAQDYDGIVPPYCNHPDSNILNSKEDRELASLKARRWRLALEPYVRDNGIFFCPKDPFAGLPPDKTPSQGLPGRSKLDWAYARGLDHSVTSYISCPGDSVRGKHLTIEDWFARGYYPTTDIYQNMHTYPRDWLFAPPEEDMNEEFLKKWLWVFVMLRLHEVAVFACDYTHFVTSDDGGWIELFYDGSVDVHTAKRPCYVWKQLEAHYKPKEGERQ